MTTPQPIVQNFRRRICSAALAIALVIFTTANPAAAHNGPPFPLFENQRVGPVILSLWVHPDLGVKSPFYIMVDPVPGSSIPNDLKIDIAVQPVTGRLPEATYKSWVDSQRGQLQFKSETQFDQQELWNVRLILTSSAGNGEAHSQVTPTPTGFGRWDLLFFALPFLAVGFLWFKALSRRRNKNRQPATPARSV